MNALCTVESTPVSTGPRDRRGRWSVMLWQPDGSRVRVMTSRYEESADRWAARINDAADALMAARLGVSPSGEASS